MPLTELHKAVMGEGEVKPNPWCKCGHLVFDHWSANGVVSSCMEGETYYDADDGSAQWEPCGCSMFREQVRA